MLKAILVNQIMMDGLGDFTHLIDIYIALKNNPQLENFEFIVVVDTILREPHGFREKLEKIGITKYFIGNRKDNLHEIPELQQHFKEATQIIEISAHGFNLEKYLPYINKNKTVFKRISEHESIDPWPKEGVDKITIFSMGLGKDTYGIKLKPVVKIEECDAYSIIEKNDSDFFESLLRYTNSKNVSELIENNIFIPAYFSKKYPLVVFLTLLILNDKIPNDKNIVMYVSGDTRGLLKDLKYYFARCWNNMSSKVNKIQLMENGSKGPELIGQFDNNLLKQITIMTGYWLTDASYQVIYQCASLLTAVSGDNTLEMSIAHKKLPYYWSTNFGLKKQTLVGLKKIVSDYLDSKNVDESLKEAFKIFFDYDTLYEINEGTPINSIINSSYKNLDFTSMAEIWPEIAQHIIENYNFYNKLPNIFLEGLPSKAEMYSSMNGKDNSALEQPNLEKVSFFGDKGHDLQCLPSQKTLNFSNA